LADTEPLAGGVGIAASSPALWSWTGLGDDSCLASGAWLIAKAENEGTKSQEIRLVAFIISMIDSRIGCPNDLVSRPDARLAPAVPAN
jgi:hypothetical protein